MAASKIHDSEHLVRWIKPAHLRRNEDGKVVGVNASAFDLRPNEKYLSASCLEDAGKDKLTSLRVLHGYFVKKFSKVGKSAFSVGNAGVVRALCSQKSSVRLLREPKPWNPAYAAVRQFPDDDIETKEQLASQHWSDWHLFADL